MRFSVRAGRLALLTLALGAAGPVRAAPAGGPSDTVRAFFDRFAKGDMKGAAALHTPAPAIIDEFPPHVWTGPGAFAGWGGDFQRFEKARGASGERLTMVAPLIARTEGDAALVVVRATFAWTQKGEALWEPAVMTFTLRRTGADWRISGWSFAPEAERKGAPPA